MFDIVADLAGSPVCSWKAEDVEAVNFRNTENLKSLQNCGWVFVPKAQLC